MIEIGNWQSAIGNAHRGIVSTVSTSVSKTESPSSNLGTPAMTIGLENSSGLEFLYGNSRMEKG